MIRRTLTLFTGLFLWLLLVCVAVEAQAEAEAPSNEAQGLSRKSHQQDQHQQDQNQHQHQQQFANQNQNQNEALAALIVEPTSVAAPAEQQLEVEGFRLRHADATATTTFDTDTELEWPWSSNDNDNNNNNNNQTQEDRTCASHTNCSTCADASWCHWCGFDCHARGSIHGCVYGASCDNHKKKKDDDKKNKKNDTDPSGCGAHDSCSECAVSSHLCHWCAHDNACHSVGSVYGCVGGVDCHSNSICERKQPEPIAAADTVFTQIGPFPLLVLMIVSAVLLCCASTCFCVAGGVKGAYDDLAGIAEDRADAVDVDDDDDDDDDDDNDAVNEPLLQQQQQQQQSWTFWAAGLFRRSAWTGTAETPEPGVTTTADDTNSEHVGADSAAAVNDSVHMVLSEEGNNTTDDVRITDDNDGPDAPLLVVPTLQQQRQQRTTTATTTQRTTTTARRPRRHMQRLYNACTVCYIFTVAVISGLLFGAVHYFPAKPVYNICNDNVAWKSLIDSMASMKVSADFEILASVNNPNYFDVALDMGKSQLSSVHKRYSSSSSSSLDGHVTSLKLLFY
jgi:hypothetical protein